MFYKELEFDWNQATDDVKVLVSEIKISFVVKF